MTTAVLDVDESRTETGEAEVLDAFNDIEDKFRYHAFRVYYTRTFAGENDLYLRFIKALVASSEPIRDRSLVLEWYRRHRRRH